MIDCKDCSGECCKRMVFPLCKTEELTRDIARWICAHIDVSIGIVGNMAVLVIQSRCMHLDNTGNCRIYGNHYDVCKEFPKEECLVNKNHIGKMLNDPTDVDEYFSK